MKLPCCAVLVVLGSAAACSGSEPNDNAASGAVAGTGASGVTTTASATGGSGGASTVSTTSAGGSNVGTGGGLTVCGTPAAQAETLASDTYSPWGIAVDDDHVYWTDSLGPVPDGGTIIGGFVMRIPIGGGAPEQVAYVLGSPNSLAIDAAKAFFVIGAAQGQIQFSPLTPSESQSASYLATAERPYGIALTATAVYFTNNLSGTVASCPKTGCTGGPTVLASGEMTPLGIALDDTHAYYTTGYASSSGSVKRVPLSGGNVETIASGQTNQGAIAVDGGYVYWIDGTAVVKAPVGGGVPVTLATNLVSPAGLAVDSGNVYTSLTLNGTSCIVRIPTSGGAPTTIATKISPKDFVVHGSKVYWADEFSGIGSAPK